MGKFTALSPSDVYPTLGSEKRMADCVTDAINRALLAMNKPDEREIVIDAPHEWNATTPSVRKLVTARFVETGWFFSAYEDQRQGVTLHFKRMRKKEGA